MLCYYCSEELGVFCESAVCTDSALVLPICIPTALTKVCNTEFNTQCSIFIYTCGSNNCSAIKACEYNVIPPEYSIGPLWSSPRKLDDTIPIIPSWWTVAHNTWGWSGERANIKLIVCNKTFLTYVLLWSFLSLLGCWDPLLLCCWLTH